MSQREIPGLVDLCCEAGFPGFPVRETPASLAAAARAGGFTDLVLSPRADPVVDTPEHVGLVTRDLGGVRCHVAGAQTRALAGEALSEAGLLQRHGAVALSDGGLPMADALVLRNALEYARRFGLVVLLRPADAALDVLGVAHEGPLAARVGLRGNPPASEEIGVARARALVRATGCPVHLTHLGTARGVAMVRAARAEGLPLTASTPARNLLLDEAVLDDGSYDARYRLHPPLRSPFDRLALIEGVRDGTLLLCADHQPRAPEEKEHEFERAVPGSTGLESAFSAAMTALEDLDLVVAALSTGPRRVLGLGPGADIRVDPDAEGVVDVTRLAGMARNDALHGQRVRGRVL
jgi:dihydroorotase